MWLRMKTEISRYIWDDDDEVSECKYNYYVEFKLEDLFEDYKVKSDM